MIDIEKVTLAWADPSGLCRGSFCRQRNREKPVICLLTALVVHAGVSLDLVARLAPRSPMSIGDYLALGHSNVGKRFFEWTLPILETEYGITRSMAEAIIRVFDTAPSEAIGADRVLSMLYTENEYERNRPALTRPAATRHAQVTMGDLMKMYAALVFSPTKTVSPYSWTDEHVAMPVLPEVPPKMTVSAIVTTTAPGDLMTELAKASPVELSPTMTARRVELIVPLTDQQLAHALGHTIIEPEKNPWASTEIGQSFVDVSVKTYEALTSQAIDDATEAMALL